MMAVMGKGALFVVLEMALAAAEGEADAGKAKAEAGEAKTEPQRMEPAGGEPVPKTIVELAGGWQNIAVGLAVAVVVCWVLQSLLAWREAQIDAAYAAKEKARLAQVDEFRQKEIAKMREARLKREAEQAVLRAKRAEEVAAAKAEGQANRAAKKKEAEAALQRRKDQLGKHVLESMETASSDAMVDGRVSKTPAATAKQVTSAATATVAKINTLKSGQLKEVLRSLDMDAKGGTADLRKRLLQAAASSGATATAISRHAHVNTALPERVTAKTQQSPAKSLISTKGNRFPAQSVVVHWTGHERRETVDVSSDETVGGLKSKISSNVIFNNPPSGAQKLVYAGRVLANDSQTLLEAKIADKSAIHLVVAAAPAPAPQPFATASAGEAGAATGTLGFLATSGAALLRKNGSRVNVESLRGKVVALYFSAHWCPPCRAFTPKLKEFYEQVNADEQKLEIIFVSSDRTAQEMAAYVTESHGDWLSLDYSARNVKDSLSQRNGVRGIPMLVVLGRDGQTVTTDGRQDVMSYGSAAFDSWDRS